MDDKKRNLVIFGTGEIAKMAYLYFSRDSLYTVAAFTLTREFKKQESFFHLPVIPFETIMLDYPPDRYEMFIAIGESRLNRDRTEFYVRAKQKGYKLASYISSQAFIDIETKIGDNCFIMENNVVQAFVQIGNNVTLWSGNHIGHGSTIHDNCFLSSHIVVSGFCEIGKNCFIGVNSSIANNVKIGDDCLIGLGSIIPKNIKPNSIYTMEYAKCQKITTKQFYSIDDKE